MKELSIEQKAKAYDEALKVLHKYDGANIMFTQDLKEEMFPELKESEDERIRKRIYDYINVTLDDNESTEKEKWLAWIEKQGEQAPSQTNERAWLYLVSDVLTWKDGIGQYLDDPRVQELAKRLCSEYAQKLYIPSVLSNYSNTAKNERKFDPKTLCPFEKVLVRDSDDDSWCCDLFSHIKEENIDYKYVASSFFCYRCCIPYNDETKHLVGTDDEAPEYYRYWED